MSDDTSAPAASTEAADAATADTTAPAQDQATRQTGQDPAATIARLEADLKAARAEAGKARTNAKQNAADEARAQLAQDIGRALGLVQDDTPPDPAELTQQLATEQTRARQTAVELAVYRAAASTGADPEALLDSRAFANAVANLDPNDRDAVKTAIASAVEANPKLAAQQQPAGPARGGAEFNGPPAQGVTAEQFAAMGYQQRVELFQSDPDTYRRLADS